MSLLRVLVRLFLPALLVAPMLVNAQEPVAGSARVRVVALMEDAASPIGVMLGGKSIGSEVPFATATASASVLAGAHSLDLVQSGDGGENILSQDVEVQNDRDYTVIAFGAVGSQQLPPGVMFASRPSNQMPPSGGSLVRIYHAAPRVSTVDIRLRDGDGAKTVESGFAYKSYTEYFPVAGGPFMLDFLEPYGHVYSRLRGVMPVGRIVSLVIGGSGDEVYMLDESDTLAQSPLPKLEIARRGIIRFVDVSPDAGPLDMFLDSATSAPASYHDATTWTDDYFSGPLSVVVAPSGAGVSNGLVGEEIEVGEDRLSSVVAVGNKSDGTLGLVLLDVGKEDDPPTPGPGQVAFRWMNAVPGSRSLTCRGYDIVELAFGEISKITLVPSHFSSAAVHFSDDSTAGSAFDGISLPEKSLVTAIVSQPYPGQSTMHIDLLIDTQEEEQTPMASLGYILSVPADPSVLPHISLQPNPATTQSHVSCTLARPDRVTISVQDMLGRRVAMIEPGLLEEGEHTLPLSVGTFAPGLYEVTVVGSDGRSVGRGALTVVR